MRLHCLSLPFTALHWPCTGLSLPFLVFALLFTVGEHVREHFPLQLLPQLLQLHL